MSTSFEQTPALPWYRHFWPWFILALLGSVVIASFVTLYIAIQNSHTLVSDDYYKEGLAINQQLARQQEAQKQSVSAQLQFAGAQGLLHVQLRGDLPEMPESLTLHVLHPTDQAGDQQVALTRVADRFYQAALPALASHAWQLQLMPADQSWRLDGRIDLSQTDSIELSAGDGRK